MEQSKEEIFNSYDLETQVRICRYTYKEGIDFKTDSEYQELYDKLPIASILRYTNWEDDDITIIEKEIEELGLGSVIQQEDLGEYGTELEYEHAKELLSMFSKSLSMAMLDDLPKVDTLFLNQARHLNITQEEKSESGVASLKQDGWHMRTIWGPNGLEVAASKGRGNNKFTLCTHMAKQLNLPDFKSNTYTMIRGEIVLDKRLPAILKKDYPNRPFKNVRNSVSSIVNETVDVAKYKDYIYFNVYAYTELDNPNRFLYHQDTLRYLRDIGFTITPFITFDITSYADFLDAFNQMQSYYLEEYEETIECDGCVIQPSKYSNKAEIDPPTAGPNLDVGICAVKADYWKKVDFVGEVVSIEMPKSEMERSIVAIIKPVNTGMSEVTRVPLINLYRALYLYDQKVDIGSKIRFSYHSNQIVKFEGFAE